jgi:hypothetical protein
VFIFLFSQLIKIEETISKNGISIPFNVARRNFRECAEDIQLVWINFSPSCPKAMQPLRLWKSMPRSFLEE